jgi:hypothetical protein
MAAFSTLAMETVPGKRNLRSYQHSHHHNTKGIASTNLTVASCESFLLIIYAIQNIPLNIAENIMF